MNSLNGADGDVSHFRFRSGATSAAPDCLPLVTVRASWRKMVWFAACVALLDISRRWNEPGDHTHCILSMNDDQTCCFY
jgi:hypothetical protein